MSNRVDDLLGQMTLEEKVSMLAGADMWHTVAIDRLGIPALKMTDGPNGARGGSFNGGATAACFPAGISLASTWNTALVQRVGEALAQETKSKGARMLLAPTVNIHRSPLNGRNFECYSEDPYLSARMVVAYITGLQQEGVAATVKHYVCNDSEFERTSISSEVTERALREIYLIPFQAAVQDAKVWAIMGAYNNINGIPATEHSYLLTDILRKEWEFDGVAVSDWFMAIKSTAASVNAGLDLEMPGPARWRGILLQQAVERGDVAEATIDESVRRLLLLLERTGVFEQPEEAPEQAINRPEHRALIREAAAEGIVLLKNENNALPLQRENLKSVAIIGPNAKTARIMAGGSAGVNPHYAITPFDGVTAKLDDHVTVGYELGCTNHKLLPLLDSTQFYADEAKAQAGFALTYFNSADLSGSPVWSDVSTASELSWFGPVPDAVDAHLFSVRATTHFIADTPGTYTFSLGSVGLSRLFINGQELIDNWTEQTQGDLYFGMGTSEVKRTIELTAGQTYTLTLEFSKHEGMPMSAVRLGCLPPLPSNMLARAVALAAGADVALIFAGLNGEWESEGFDRPNMDLVGEQNALIEQVAAANKNTIVVLNTGSPITMPWLDKVAAVVQAWYPGQECGNAIADVLFGDVNPSGKLTQTFPMRVEDNPAHINYPGENGKVYYGEGLFVGYRYYEKKKLAPLFPFGFGLSYTTFSYGNLRLSTKEFDPIGWQKSLQISVDITNTGTRAGQEIVQVYIHDVQSRLHRPEKELKAFSKVALAPGECQTVTLSINDDTLAYYDDLAHEWIAEEGEFEVLVGSSSQDIRARTSFVLTASSHTPTLDTFSSL